MVYVIGKHIFQSDTFEEPTELYHSIVFWMFYISGNIGDFANIRVKVSLLLH